MLAFSPNPGFPQQSESMFYGSSTQIVIIVWIQVQVLFTHHISAGTTNVIIISIQLGRIIWQLGLAFLREMTDSPYRIRFLHTLILSILTISEVISAASSINNSSRKMINQLLRPVSKQSSLFGYYVNPEARMTSVSNYRIIDQILYYYIYMYSFR